MNQNYNPLAPDIALSNDAVMQAYREHANSIRGEVKVEQDNSNGYNPFTPTEDTQTDKQQAHISNMEQFLAPVPMNQYDINNENSDEEKQVFNDHFVNDPAIKEFGEDFVAKLEVLRQAMKNGQIDINSARSIIASYGQEVIDPALERHHGKHSNTHKISMLDVKHAAYLKGGK
ncbi:TPA: hypothetical protein QH056_001822 [Klebsiella oxytoca]|nr:hypothetical protein [Klebsiella oxytoca]